MQGGDVEVTAGAEGGQLAITVTGIGFGSHTEGGKHRAGPEADSAEGGLGDFRCTKLRFILLPGGLVKSGPGVDEFGQAALSATAVGGKCAICVLEGFQELRELDRQVLEHPGILGTLSRKKYRQAAGGFTPGKEGAVGGIPGTLTTLAAQHGQSTFHLGRRLGGRLVHDHDQAAGLPQIETAPGLLGSQAQSGPSFIRRKIFQVGFQTTLVSRTEGCQLYVALPVGRCFERLVFLEQAVEVAATKTERADAGPAGVIPARYPRPGLGVDIEWRTCRSDGILRLLHLDGRRQGLVVERHGRLDQAGSAGRSLGVADLGLDRTDGAPGGIGDAKDFLERRYLDGVSDLGAGAVGFNQLDGLRVDTTLLVGPLQGFLLTGRTWLVDGTCAAVAGGSDPLDDRVNPVAVALGIGQALDDDDPEPLTQGGAVGVDIKWLGMSGRGERRRLAEAGVHEDVVESVDSTGHHHVGLAGGQLEGGQVEGAQGTAAGCIYDAIGAAEVEVLADPSCDHVAEQAGEGIFLPGHIGVTDALHDVLGDGFGDTGVFQGFAPAGMPKTGAERHDQLQRAGDAEDHADPIAVEVPFRGVAGILERLVDSDQAKQLRGIDRFQRIGQYAVFHRVEINRGQEPAVLGVDLVGSLGVRIEIIIGTPVAFGDLGDRIDSLLDVGPESPFIFCPGKQAAYTDNGQRRRCRDLPVIFSAVVLQLRNSLICSISRGTASAVSSSKRTP